jgi:hypothetical protein
VDLASGLVVWSLPIRSGSRLSVGSDPSGEARWVGVTAGGLISVYDLRTGDLRAVMRPAMVRQVRLVAAGEQALIMERDERDVRVTAYGGSGFGPQWVSRVPFPSGAGFTDLEVLATSRCGPAICLGSVFETVALDPATGRQRWRVPAMLARAGSGVGLFVRLMSRPGGHPQISGYSLTTGKPVVDLRGWELLTRRGPPTDIALFAAVSGQHKWFWAVDLATGVVTSIGPVPEREAAQCEALSRYLVCRSDASQLRLWRLST